MKMNNLLKQYNFIFDMDGVIIDSEYAHFTAFKWAIKKRLNYGLNEEEYQKIFAGKISRQGLNDFLKAKNIKDDVNILLDIKQKVYENSFSYNVKPYRDALVFINFLCISKVPLALTTSSSSLQVNLSINKFGLKNKFVAAISCEDVTQGKPDPEPYILTARRINRDPSKCIVIEDTPNGIRAAKNAGMICIAVTNTHSQDKLSDADFIVSSLDELMPKKHALSVF